MRYVSNDIPMLPPWSDDEVQMAWNRMLQSVVSTRYLSAKRWSQIFAGIGNLALATFTFLAITSVVVTMLPSGAVPHEFKVGMMVCFFTALLCFGVHTLGNRLQSIEHIVRLQSAAIQSSRMVDPVFLPVDSDADEIYESLLRETQELQNWVRQNTMSPTHNQEPSTYPATERMASSSAIEG